MIKIYLNLKLFWIIKYNKNCSSQKQKKKKTKIPSKFLLER